MRLSTLRSLSALLLAATLTALAVPMASAAPITITDSTKYSYPGWGQAFDANALASAISAQAGKNLVDPSKPQFPATGMKITTPDNSTASDPSAFGASGVEAWFGKPNQLTIDGCDVFNVVLKRDLYAVKTDSDGCKVTSGSFVSAFYPKDTPATYDPANPSIVVTQVVPLSYAYGRGAWAMDPDTRLALANDPLNLVATHVTQSGPTSILGQGLYTNASDLSGEFDPESPVGFETKGAATNMYMARFTAVMMKYGLTLEPSSILRYSQDITKAPDAASTVDSSPEGLKKLSTTRFTQLIPEFKVPEKLAQAEQAAQANTPSASASAQSTDTGSPVSTQKNDSSSIPLLAGIGLAVLAAFSIGAWAYRSRDKRGGSRAG